MYFNTDNHKIRYMTAENTHAAADSLQILPLAECPQYREKAMEIYRDSFPEDELTDISGLPEALPSSMNFEEWVLVYGKRAVGYLIVLFTDDVAYFLHLAVAEECRGKGFGSSAMEFLNKRFASHLVFFSVETPSEKAENQQQRLARIRLYERMGYRLSGIEILDNEISYSVMCRSSADEKESESIRAYIKNSLLAVFGGNATITG